MSMLTAIPRSVAWNKMFCYINHRYTNKLKSYNQQSCINVEGWLTNNYHNYLLIFLHHSLSLERTLYKISKCTSWQISDMTLSNHFYYNLHTSIVTPQIVFKIGLEVIPRCGWNCSDVAFWKTCNIRVIITT